MLTQNCVRLAIKSLKLYSSLGFYPIGFQNDGLPTPPSLKRRSKAWRCLLVTSVIYTIFVATRLGRTVGGNGEDTEVTHNMHAVPLHAIILVGGTAAIVTYALLWHSSTAWLNICLVRDLLTGLPQGKFMRHSKLSRL